MHHLEPGKNLRTLALILILSLGAMGSLFWLMGRLATHPSPNAGASSAAVPRPSAVSHTTAPKPTLAPDVVVTVEGEIITRPAWQRVTRLDAMMSGLAGRPAPTAEETLDRLINEIIILAATAPAPAPPPAEITGRLARLQAEWQVTDETVEAILVEAGLNRTDLLDRVGHLIQVEAGLRQIEARESNLETWLLRSRAASEISLYQPLAQTAPAVSAEAIIATPPPLPISPTLVAMPAPPPGVSIAPYVGQVAPEMTLALLDGDPVTLSHLRGRPVVINFWASWCPPCRQELPALQAAYTRYGDRVEFVAVNVKETPETVSAFVQEAGLGFPVALDADGQVSDLSYEVRGLPTTLFIDSNGVVAARHVGPLDEGTVDNYLVSLLTPPPPEPAAQLAPDFSLTAASGEVISLSSFRDKRKVVLVFYRGLT